jgi:hypothetical protein
MTIKVISPLSMNQLRKRNLKMTDTAEDLILRCPGTPHRKHTDAKKPCPLEVGKRNETFSP